MQKYKKKTIDAFIWSFGSQLSSQVVSFVFGITLARLLVPDDFGIVAMANVFVGFAEVISSLGFGAALVQKKDVTERHYSSVFWLNLFIGLTLTITIYSASNVISNFYGRDEVAGITKILSFTFILGALGSVPRTRLVKELRFKSQSIADFVAMLVSGIIAIGLALSKIGYYSLVLNILLQRCISTALIWHLGKWYPKEEASRKCLSQLFEFSASLFGSNLLRFAASNLDRLLLGKMLGGKELGLYNRAASMMFIPLTNISHVVSSVMFPSLSIIQENTNEVKRVYLKIISSVSFVTFPMMIGLFAVSETFVLALLGNNWAGMIKIIQVMCIAGVVTSISTLTGSIFQSQGATKLELKITVVMVVIRIVGIILGIRWGAVGVAFGFSICMIINGIIGIAVARRLISMNMYEVVIKLLPNCLQALLMGFIVWQLRYLQGHINILLVLCIQIFVGIVVYIGISIISKNPVIKEIQSIVKSKI